MGNTLRILVVLAAVLVAVVASAAPEGEGTTNHSSEDGRVSFVLPAAWSCRTIPPSETIPVHVAATIPGATSYVGVQIVRVAGMRNERGQIYLEWEEQPPKFGITARGRTGLDPVPHLVMEFPKDGATRRGLWIPRIIDRCGYTLLAECAPADWDLVKDSFFAAAQSMTSSLGEWPERPAGYRVSVRDGYEYLLAPAVKSAEADAVHASVLDIEAGYVKVHGPVPKLESNRIVVVVHATKDAAAALCKEAASVPHGTFGSQIEGRLFTVPPQKGNAEQAAEFATALTSILHYQLYGRGAPSWLYLGDPYVARQEALAGKPLPSLAESQISVVPRSVDPFATLAARAAAGGDVRRQLLVYEGLFRCGPATYRNAFTAFLKELAATGDAAAAQAAHLDSLDAAKLQAAAVEFAGRGFKPVKSR